MKFSSILGAPPASLVGPLAQLYLTNQTFVEHPRHPDSFTCGGSDMDRFSVNLANNVVLLDDLPGEFAIGMIPGSAGELSSCADSASAFKELWFDSSRHVSPLIHSYLDPRIAPDSCAASYVFDSASGGYRSDPGLYESALGAEISLLEGVTKTVEFVSGVNTHSDVDIPCDWVNALTRIGAPGDYLFFGAATLATVDQGSDVRGKDPFPLDTWASTRSYHTDDFLHPDLDTGGTTGIRMVPGSDTPVFNLGGCGNLYLRECHESGMDRNLDITRRDIEVLNLLVRRALAVRADDGRAHHWSFHLPCLAAYDYTTMLDGSDICDRAADGTWTTIGAGTPDARQPSSRSSTSTSTPAST